MSIFPGGHRPGQQITPANQFHLRVCYAHRAALFYEGLLKEAVTRAGGSQKPVLAYSVPPAKYSS